MKEFIYLVQVENSNICKIGVTKDPERRLRELNASSPVNLAFLTLCAVKDGQAYWLESLMKNTLKSVYKHLHNEWFELDKSDRDFIIDDLKTYSKYTHSDWIKYSKGKEVNKD